MSDRPNDTDCIFCAIVNGDIPARTVTTTDETIAFLDVNPLAPGHTLVIPKGHYETIADAPPSVRNAVFQQLAALAEPVEAAVGADASNIGINNGAEAGQEIPHLHGHIVPRFMDDGGKPIHAVAGKKPTLSDAELDDIAASISERV